MRRAFARHLGVDRRGATIVEFALITPVMLALISGMSELAYQGYLQSVLTGAIQKAGRDSTIQDNNKQTTQIDAAVIAQLGQLASGWTKNCSDTPPANARTYCSTRKSYSTFADVGPEPYADSNHNGQYDAASECFTDTNNNKVWDSGLEGQGGANDVTVYSIKLTYPRLFPVSALIGMSKTATLNGSTTLKNQPWATQTVYAPTQVCPK